MFLLNFQHQAQILKIDFDEYARNMKTSPTKNIVSTQAKRGLCTFAHIDHSFGDLVVPARQGDFDIATYKFL